MDLYWFWKWFFYFVLRVFFSEIEVIGRENIPREGAVIFVGNHQNQFVDPMLIMTHCVRPLGFLTAAKSMKKAVVGFFARSLHSIPVVRALDAASPGVGTVSISGKNVTGNGTNFTKQLEKGFSIFVNGMEDPIRVDDITSDTEAILSQPFECQNSKWKCIPKLDHSGVYDVVFERLGQGRCVGIFPEGGSHDRTQLLPLKAGVTLMALGAMDKYNIPVTIVPVGLNYFSGHRFRSHVLVEFGKAYQIPNDTLLQYRKNKREACSSLLGQVERSMRTVTMNAPDFDTLRAIHTIRRLYQPSSKTLTSDQYLELNRRFAAAYIKFKDFPQIQAVESRIKDYNLRLDMLGVKDLHVAAADTMGSTFMFLVALVLRFALLVGLAVVALPGIILISPIGLLAKIISIRKAKQALRSSTVKLKGTDVIASYKLIIGLVATPILYWIYALFVTIWFGFFYGVAFMFTWPLFSIASIRVIEEDIHLWRSMLALLRIKWAASELHKLRQERDELQKQVRLLVEEWGPKMGSDIWDHRIVTVEDFTHEEDTPAGLNVSSPEVLLRNRNKAFKKRSEANLLQNHQLLHEADLDDLEDVFN